jgi:hypothetical protein
MACACARRNAALARHPQFERSLGELRLAGAHVLYGEGEHVPDEPGRSRPEKFPWQPLLEAVAAAAATPR